MIRRNDFRARGHPAWWAFWLHRVSGLVLAIFLPLHFLALGQALHGAAALQGFLSWTHSPWFKIAEWGLVVLLALHFAGGIRLLLIEFGRTTDLKKNWIAAGIAFSLLVGMAFGLSLVG